MNWRRSLLLILLLGGLAQAQNLRILSAQYGHDNRWIDVTAQLNNSIRNNRLDMSVSNNTFGRDPAPAEPKMLRVEYVWNGVTRSEEFPENANITLPSVSSPYTGGTTPPGRRYNVRGGLRILSANYGAGNRMQDVTPLLQERLSGDTLFLRVDNGSMRGDPAVGTPKVLIVDYEYQGQRLRAQVPEGQDLRLPEGGGMPAQGNYGGAGLRILSASYGSRNRTVDVTPNVSAYVRGQQLRMRVNNDTMGGDPERGATKVLRIQYSFNGQVDTIEVNEENDLELPRPGIGGGFNSQPAYRDELVIQSASYGARDRFRDVTQLVTSRMNGNTLRMRVNNQTMGGDPRPGPDKVLRIEYVYRGQPMRKEIREGDDLVLP